jgi:hypothetical protein
MHEAWGLIVDRAELDVRPSLVSTDEPREAILAALTQRFAWILEHDVARLPWWLYRFDVREADVSRAFDESTVSSLPRSLAELLLERTLEKVASRRRWAAELGGDADLDD